MKKILSVIVSIAVLLTSMGAAVGISASAQVTAGSDTTSNVSAYSQAAVDTALVDLTSSKVLSTSKGLDFSSWDSFVASVQTVLFKAIQILIDSLISAICSVVPTVNIPDTYETTDFYSGMTDYLTSPAENAQWSLGYSSASISDGNELDGKHYVGGTPGSKVVTEVKDDQRVRVTALNDGSGRGTVVFAVIDAYGLSLTDVREIRSRLTRFAVINGIVGINIGVLHQHSCVDTFGLDGNLAQMFIGNQGVNLINNTLGLNVPLFTGKNDSFMENLFSVCALTIRDACNNMTTGKMYYSKVDATQYIHDKREPFVNDNYLHRIRFVPDNGSKETYLMNAAIHCVGHGAAGTLVTGDWPYYVEQVVNSKANANFMLVLGAELAMTMDSSTIESDETDTRYDGLVKYGTTLGNLFVSEQTETVVEPLLNYNMTEYKIPVKNQILAFAAKFGVVNNIAVSNNDADTDLDVVTEIGYMELGSTLSVAIVPGELEPAIAYGGLLEADKTWTGEEFNYPSFSEIVGTNRELLVFGICNDQIGYILPDNDYRSILSGYDQEISSLGNQTGSSTVEAFQGLVESMRKTDVN